MKLIVDIPYETYKDYMTDRIKTTDVLQAVRHGKPLPKHHGRLGDLDELERKMTEYISTLPLAYNEAERIVLLMNFFDEAGTIIEGSDKK